MKSIKELKNKLKELSKIPLQMRKEVVKVVTEIIRTEVKLAREETKEQILKEIEKKLKVRTSGFFISDKNWKEIKK